MAGFSLADLKNQLDIHVLSSGLETPRSIRHLRRYQSVQRDLLAALNRFDIKPLRVVGSGDQGVVFDIGNGQVARFTLNRESHPSIPDFPGPLKILPVGRRHSLEITEYLPHDGTQAEYEFMSERLRRNGLLWVDASEDNVRRRENGELVVHDENLVPDTTPPTNRLCLFVLKNSRVEQPSTRDILIAERWNGKERTSSWLMWRPDKKCWLPAPSMHKFWDASKRWRNSGVLQIQFGDTWEQDAKSERRTFSRTDYPNFKNIRLPTAKEFDAAVPQLMSTPPSLNSGVTL